MTSTQTFDPATVSVVIQEALLTRFSGPIVVHGVLSDWRATPKFGRGRLTAEGDPSAHLPIGMPMWRSGGGKQHLTKGQRVTVVGDLQWHATFGLQLMATQIRTSGKSTQQQAVEALKTSLRQRQVGLAQRELCARAPGRIAILAPHGGAAALTDARAILNDLPTNVLVVSHRIPMGGPAAPVEIAQALLSLSRTADLILIVRGGGSSTDLTVWDNPSVVKRISACPIPIVVGIGHSTNTSAAGLVAHHCAITPTAAAQWVRDLYTAVPAQQAAMRVQPRQARAKDSGSRRTTPRRLDDPPAIQRHKMPSGMVTTGVLVAVTLLVALALLVLY